MVIEFLLCNYALIQAHIDYVSDIIREYDTSILGIAVGKGKAAVYPFRFEFVVHLRTFYIYYSERNTEYSLSA